ncbi:hypothetical protein ACQ4LE_010994 [Meloidogyne hapla]
MYLNIKILLIFLLTILICYKAELQITCVNDYLLLWKNLQTTVYAEKIKNKWKVKRGIHKDDMENLKDFDIEKEKMAELMEEKYAKDCFKLNKELVEKYNEKVLNKMKNMILRRGKEVFSFKDFTNKVEKEYFILSEDIQKKLEEQSFCLANSIYNIYKNENRQDEVLDIKSYSPKNINNENDAILDKYKIPFEEKFYIVKIKLPSNTDLIEQNYYGVIMECEKIISQKYYYAKFFLKFDTDQLYLDEFPDTGFSLVSDFVLNEKPEKENKDADCSICLGNLIEKVRKDEEKFEEIQQISKCKHIFHKKCLQTWFTKKPNVDKDDCTFIKEGCPKCRENVLNVP